MDANDSPAETPAQKPGRLPVAGGECVRLRAAPPRRARAPARPAQRRPSPSAGVNTGVSGALAAITAAGSRTWSTTMTTPPVATPW